MGKSKGKSSGKSKGSTDGFDGSLTEDDRKTIHLAKQSLRDNLEKHNLFEIRKSWLLLEHFMVNYEKANLSNDEECEELIQQAEIQLNEWKKILKVNDHFEIFIPEEDLWYIARIVDFDATKNQHLVKFLGWSDKYNRYLLLANELINPTGTLLPAHGAGEKSEEQSETAASVPGSEKKGSRSSKGKVMLEEVSDEVSLSKTEQDNSFSSSVMEVENGHQENGKEKSSSNEGNKDNTTTDAGSVEGEKYFSHTGRQVRRGTLLASVNSKEKSKETKAKKEKSSDASSSSPTEQEENGSLAGSSNGKDKKDKDDGTTDYNDWKCTICGMVEDIKGTQLLLCDGPCRRSYHEGCLQSSNITPADEEEWWCLDCTEGCHPCFICGAKGQDYLVRSCFLCLAECFSYSCFPGLLLFTSIV
jgi:ribosomal protein S19E (S16A)